MEQADCPKMVAQSTILWDVQPLQNMQSLRKFLRLKLTQALIFTKCVCWDVEYQQVAELYQESFFF